MLMMKHRVYLANCKEPVFHGVEKNNTHATKHFNNYDQPSRELMYTIIQNGLMQYVLLTLVHKQFHHSNVEMTGSK